MDLRVMSPTSYQTALPRVALSSVPYKSVKGATPHFNEQGKRKKITELEF